MIEVIEKIGNIENLSLKNEEMEVVVSTFGCTIIKMIVEDKNGVKGDVVLGYDDFNQYQTLDAYLGALVGRVANRIGKGTFELNGETYHLPINNGPNSAPSVRLKKLIPGSDKVVYGFCIISEIGMETILSKCPRFNGWIHYCPKKFSQT